MENLGIVVEEQGAEGGGSIGISCQLDDACRNYLSFFHIFVFGKF